MKKLLIIILVIGSVFSSCNDRLEDLNMPQKNAIEVPPDRLFANGVREMFDLMASTDVNSNVFRLYAQYWAQTTYPDESQYNMVGRQIPDNFWTFAYRNVLMDLEEAKDVLNAQWEEMLMEEAVKNNQIAVIDICQSYMYAILVDAFGAIPYGEALNREILVPAYEPGADVYTKVIDTLNAAINMIDLEADAFSSGQDPIYEGDIEKWKKFANSFKLRLAMNLADVDNPKATAMVAEALASGVFTSNEDNASITYYADPPNTNPVWEDLVQSGRADYVISNTIVDVLQDFRDPRLPIYAGGRSFAYPVDEATNLKRDSTLAGGEVTLYYPDSDSTVFVTTPFTILAEDSLKEVQLFRGGEYGTANTYSANSHVGDLFHEPDLEGVIMDYAQVQFLLAEAAARGFTTPLTVEEHYSTAITASLEYWGIDEEAIEEYLMRPEVEYSTAEGEWNQKIGVQSWLALYNNGFEGWTVWRRLDFEGFNVPEGLEAEDIPKRMIFPIEEATLNPSNLRAAIDLIGGSDNVQTQVFWDTK